MSVQSPEDLANQAYNAALSVLTHGSKAREAVKFLRNLSDTNEVVRSAIKDASAHFGLDLEAPSAIVSAYGNSATREYRASGTHLAA